MAYAKANPGKLNYGLGGTRHHHPPVRRDALPGSRHQDDPRALSRQRPATNALLAGEIQAQFDQTTLPHIKAGKLKALAMLAEVRHPDFPNVPTLQEAGYGKEGGDPGSASWHPAGTSPDAIARLDKAIAEALRAPDIIEKVHNGGMRVTYLDPAGFRARIGGESRMFGDDHPEGRHQAALRTSRVFPEVRTTSGVTTKTSS